MADHKPNNDADRIAEEFARLIRQTPPEVIQEMDKRLQELRSTPTADTITQLMRKRTG